MGTPLRILVVDDSEDDTILLARELARGGYEPHHRRVDSEQALLAALEESDWDIILGDFTIPNFSGMRALQLVRERGMDVPFIFVSGTMGEDVAVQAMKAGAEDYVVKGKLGRLIPAIERELREAEMRRDAALAEERLRKLSRAVDNSANLVLITDAKGVIEYVNPRLLEATGYSAYEVIGGKPSLWKSEATDEKTYADLWRTILAGHDWHGEFVNRCRDGSLIEVSAVISPIKDASGRVTHFIGIEEDITHRKELERQLQHAQKMESVGQLTGGIAHDFNNLLAVVIGNLDLLIDELRSDTKAQQLAQDALAASLRGADLTHRLLAFARHQALNPSPFDLNELVTEIADMLRRTLGEHVEIKLVLAADLWQGLADPSQVESALTNLAINARDAMPDGGQLTIETSNLHLDEVTAAEYMDLSSGDYVVLSVSDTGKGIPVEILDRVVEPFFTSKEPGKGTGLGLSMIYGFAKQSQGELQITSRVGHGTTVRLSLPRAKTDTTASPDNRPEAAGANGDEATILVVEDNADVRRVASRQLASLGYRIVEAENAAAALDVLRTEQPIDLLFTDMIMPGGMSGTDLVREAGRIRPGLRHLITSGYADDNTPFSLEPGVRGSVLGKPYRKSELARRLREILRGSDDSSSDSHNGS